MSIFDFDLRDIELPHIARGLCSEVYKIALGYLGDSDSDTINKVVHQNFNRMLDFNEVVDVGAINDITDKIKNPSSLASDHEFWENSIQFLTSESAIKTGMDQFVNSVYEENNFVFFGGVLIVFILILKNEEQTLLENQESLGYVAIVEKLDGLVTLINELYLSIKILDPVTELVEQKFKRREGAKKGAAGKRARTAKLKIIILDQARAEYADLSAAMAAQAIYDGLKMSDDMKNDEGNHLLKNPASAFKGWINDDRKQE